MARPRRAPHGVARPAAATTISALAAAMADLLAPTLGASALGEARELLASLHDMPRHWPVLAHDRDVTAAEWRRGLAAASTRACGAPLQYAAARAAFRHLTLEVDERVLIPRPETEQLVELVLRATSGARGGVVADVGTGSGAIAIALASEGDFDRVVATDVSCDAVAVARANAARHASVLRAMLDVRHGTLLAPVTERPLRVVVSNPPYIAFDEASGLPGGVRDWEPSVALFSGDGGMAMTERLVRDAAPALGGGGLLALEVDVRRAARVAALAAAHGSYDDVEILLDLTGRERFVVARRREM